ncbi:MAG: Fic family protein [Acidimicrobiia bacterium]|nr:Fic family protein [Acidimicrobiia bacterium]
MVRRTLERVEVEDWIDRLARHDGEARLHRTRDRARELAPVLGLERQMDILDGLIGAALRTHNATLVSPSLRARAVGQAYDPERVAGFEAFADVLEARAPAIVPGLPGDEPRRRFLPFYEAYFSNFIEGTEFTPDEAASIVFDDVVPANRPADAHDITGTYRIVADPAEMSRAPRDPDEFLDLLRGRHAVLMAGRPDKGPGQFKQRDNRAGGTDFVAHELVEGTLRAGVDVGAPVGGAFARAAYTMFLVSEVHPFADGNGRIARVMMNAALVSAGEGRIIVPTVYRDNDVLALRGATHNRHFDGLLAVLEFAQRYTARVDFTDRHTAEADLPRTNAFRDPVEADNAGIRLVLP